MGPIGVFDSGYGGLTILHGIRQVLPEYDYLYLDNDNDCGTELFITLGDYEGNP